MAVLLELAGWSSTTINAGLEEDEQDKEDEEQPDDEDQGPMGIPGSLVLWEDVGDEQIMYGGASEGTRLVYGTRPGNYYYI